eukprot:6823491-Alexandrium_andersonii.AAC.1
MSHVLHARCRVCRLGARVCMTSASLEREHDLTSGDVCVSEGVLRLKEETARAAQQQARRARAQAREATP